MIFEVYGTAVAQSVYRLSYELGGSGVRIPAGTIDFSFIQNAQTSSEAHTARVPEYFSGVKALGK